MSFIPYPTVKGAAQAIEFDMAAFGATQIYRISMVESIGHAELKIGEAPFMLSDEFPEMDIPGPKARGGSPVCTHLYVADADTFFARAVAAGAKVVRPLEDQFHGDRGGKPEDPFGHMWRFATCKEELTVAEIQRRAAAVG
jgi:PhnB protein